MGPKYAAHRGSSTERRRTTIHRLGRWPSYRATLVPPVFFLVLAVIGSNLHRVMAQKSQQKVQQRNSYLDLWSNVFDVLDTDTIDAEVATLENLVECIDPGTDDTPKHRLMDILESRRKEKRSASFLKGLAAQHGGISSGRMFGGSGGGAAGVGASLGPGARNPRASSKFRQLGIPADGAVFEGKLCFKMQNLGNADKYHSVVTGSPGCDENDGAQDTVSSMMTWKSETAFAFDCSISSAVQNATEGSAVASIRAALSKGTYSEGSQELAVLSRASCTLSVVSESAEGAVTTENGDGAIHSHKPSASMLKVIDAPLQTDHAIDVAPLNAIKIKMCNLPSAWSESRASMGPSDSGDVDNALNSTESMTIAESADSVPSVALPKLKLNGKRLTSQALFSSAGPTCATHTYRVPSVGLSGEGFVLSGSMIVNEAQKLGAGRASSVEVTFGSVSLIDTSLADVGGGPSGDETT